MLYFVLAEIVYRAMDSGVGLAESGEYESERRML